MYHPIFSDFSLQLYKPGNILHLAEGSCEKGSSHQEENDRMCPRNGPHARRISVCACLPSISSSNTSLRTTRKKEGSNFPPGYLYYSKKWIVGFFQHDDAAINDSSCVTGEVILQGLREAQAAVTECIYLLVMPKYWGGNYFAHGSFPKVGQKQKTEEKKKEERKKERKTEQW